MMELRQDAPVRKLVGELKEEWEKYYLFLEDTKNQSNKVLQRHVVDDKQWNILEKILKKSDLLIAPPLKKSKKSKHLGIRPGNLLGQSPIEQQFAISELQRLNVELSKCEQKVSLQFHNGSWVVNPTAPSSENLHLPPQTPEPITDRKNQKNQQNHNNQKNSNNLPTRQDPQTHSLSPSLGPSLLPFLDYSILSLSPCTVNRDRSDEEFIQIDDEPGTPCNSILPEITKPPEVACKNFTLKSAITILFDDLAAFRSSVRQIWMVCISQASNRRSDPGINVYKPNLVLSEQELEMFSGTSITKEEAETSRSGTSTELSSLLADADDTTHFPLSGLVALDGSPLISTLGHCGNGKQFHTDIRKLKDICVETIDNSKWRHEYGEWAQSLFDETKKVPTLVEWHQSILDALRIDRPAETQEWSSGFPNGVLGQLPPLEPALPGDSHPSLPPKSHIDWAHSESLVSRARRGSMMMIQNFDSIDPETITHAIWTGQETVDAPTADLYIKKFGPVPLGFDPEEHLGKSDGEIAGMFRPVKGVYFVKYNAMWFAEWHDIDRTRHRTRFSVQKYGHCMARALAIEKRAEADKIKSRMLMERSHKLKTLATGGSKTETRTASYPMSYKIGPTWTGLPDPDDLEVPIKKITKKPGPRPSVSRGRREKKEFSKNSKR